MKTTQFNKALLLLPTCLILAFNSGCSNTAAAYQPIVDGPKGAKYAQDLQACQQLAQQRSYLNDDVKTEALLGSIIGALAASADDEEDITATEGFIAGGLAGGAGRSWDVRNERKNIVLSCMKQRGHRVVG